MRENQEQTITMKQLNPSSIFFLIAMLAITSCGPAEQNRFSMSPLFSDHMVLQQQENVAFWGEANPNQEVIIVGSWGSKSNTKTDTSGKWMAKLNTPNAGGPFEVEIKSGAETKIIRDVLIGEVWLAAGQSNMEMDFAYCCNSTDRSEEEIATANFPKIRMLNVQKQLSTAPTKQFEGSWEKAIGENITDFSAAGYFFAKRLHNELKVPIGIVHSSWGGSDAEAWTSSEKLRTLGLFDKSLDAYDTLVADASKSEEWFSQFESVNLPSAVWYLFTGDYFGFPDKWKSLDFKDQKYIAPLYDTKGWNEISLPGAFDDIFNTNDFDGVVLFKKTFVLSEIQGDYSIRLGAVTDMDFTYVNGKQIGATLGKESGNSKEYPIPSSILKTGENTIVIRVLNNYGDGTIGDIQLTSSAGVDKSLAGEWKYRVSAEIYRQMDSYEWPYSALYFYNKEDIDFSVRPSVNKFHHNVKSSLYNGMINPLIPYKIKGALWYQGENNVQRFEEYEKLFTAMIIDWRERWNDDFPFYFVQIAPFYNYNGLSSSLRDAQRKTLILDKTGMVVTLDIGENKDIHPSNKYDVGIRLAGLALAENYGRKNVASGPLYKDHEISGNKIFVDFDYVGSGMIFKDNGTDGLGFEIAGVDKIFVPAKARIRNNHIEVFSLKILEPKHVRYAWSDTSSATLFNIDGLPASSFLSK